MVYALPIPRGHENYDICQLEMVNIVVALKIWANHWKNKRIHVFCDNIAVVQVLNTGKARDSILATCARNVWLIAAIFNIELKFSHISGKTNVIADLLSRWSMVPDPHEKLKQMLPQYKWVDSHIELTALNHDYSILHSLFPVFQFCQVRQPSWPLLLLTGCYRGSDPPL